jgi:hypothetical protein
MSGDETGGPNITMENVGPWMAAREVFLGKGFTPIGETEQLARLSLLEAKNC